MDAPESLTMAIMLFESTMHFACNLVMISDLMVHIDLARHHWCLQRLTRSCFASLGQSLTYLIEQPAGIIL